MKKLLSLAVLSLGMITVANAEEYAPEKGDFAVELGFTPFNTADGSSFKLNDGMLKVRYFLSSKDALRLKIGFGIQNSKDTETYFSEPDEDDKANAWSIVDRTITEKNKNTNFSFMVGYERHLFTKGRFDVYAGLELGYGIQKFSGTETEVSTTKQYNGKTYLGYVDYDDVTTYTNQGTPGNGGVSLNYFSGNLFAGVDFYVWKNLYLGAELGLNFKTGKSPNTYRDYTGNAISYNAAGTVTDYVKTNFDGESNTTVTTTKIGDNVTTTTTHGPVRTNVTRTTSVGLYVEPAIRIGWRF